MNFFYRKNRKTDININGVNYKVLNTELKTTVPMLVAYSLNELGTSSSKAFEFAIMTIALLVKKNASEIVIKQSENILNEARMWKEKVFYSELLITASTGVVKKFLKEARNYVSAEAIFLKCSILMIISREENKEISEIEYNTIKDFYNRFTVTKLSNAEFDSLYKEIWDESIFERDWALERLSNNIAILSQNEKEIILKSLLYVSRASSQATENDLPFFKTAISTFEIEKSRFLEIIKEATEVILKIKDGKKEHDSDKNINAKTSIKLISNFLIERLLKLELFKNENVINDSTIFQTGEAFLSPHCIKYGYALHLIANLRINKLALTSKEANKIKYGLRMDTIGMLMEDEKKWDQEQLKLRKSSPCLSEEDYQGHFDEIDLTIAAYFIEIERGSELPELVLARHLIHQINITYENNKETFKSILVDIILWTQNLLESYKIEK